MCRPRLLYICPPLLPQVLLLENVRFYKAEEKNDPEFAKALAGPGEPPWPPTCCPLFLHRLLPGPASPPFCLHLTPASGAPPGRF